MNSMVIFFVSYTYLFILFLSLLFWFVTLKDSLTLRYFLSLISALSLSFLLEPLLLILYMLLLGFLLFSLIIYIYFYTWRNLIISLSSYLCFSIILFVCFSYVTMIILTFSLKHTEPFYIENLSHFNVYKYMVFLGLTIVLSCCYLFSYYIKSNMREFLTYPYLNKEMNQILNSWVNSFIGTMSNYVLDNLLDNKHFRRCLFITHFIMLYIPKIIQNCLLINFVFFHGDLRYCLYLLPFSFISWILSFMITILKQYILKVAMSIFQLS